MSGLESLARCGIDALRIKDSLIILSSRCGCSLPAFLLRVGFHQQQLHLTLFRVVYVRGRRQIVRGMLIGHSRSLAAKVWPDEGNAGAAELHPEMLGIRPRANEGAGDGESVEADGLDA